MPRLPYGAETFIEQVQALRKSAKVESHGDPDGFDVQRSVTFDKATSKWLEPILDHFGDPRIVGYSTSKDLLTVDFSDQSVVADQRDPYPLEAAAEVAEDAAKQDKADN